MSLVKRKSVYAMYAVKRLVFSLSTRIEPRQEKTVFCICGNRSADQRFCFRYIVQSLYFLNPKFKASSHIMWLYIPVWSDRTGNPEYMFSHNAAQIILKPTS